MTRAQALRKARALLGARAVVIYTPRPHTIESKKTPGTRFVVRDRYVIGKLGGTIFGLAVHYYGDGPSWDAAIAAATTNLAPGGRGTKGFGTSLLPYLRGEEMPEEFRPKPKRVRRG